MIFAINGAAESPVFVNSLEDAVALAESSNKDILVVFSADWCKNCKLLKSEFLDSNDPSIDDTIVCIVDYDSRPDLIKEYKVHKIPDSRIIRRNVEISNIIGFINKYKYKKWLNNARH
jgi:thioredoxin-like negative regulator of GroEL